VRARAVLLVMLLLTSSISALQVGWSGPDTIAVTTTSEPINSTGFEVPANATVSGARLQIEPEFPINLDNGTHFGWDVDQGFVSGNFSQTSIVSKQGKLSLAQDSAIGQLTDFEDLRQEFTNWSSGGENATVWSIVFPGGNGLPNNTTEGNWMAGTSRAGPIDAGIESTLTSSVWYLGETISNLTIEWDQWIDLDDDDKFWLEISTDAGLNWSNASTPWNGSNKVWSHQNFTLDDLMPADATSLQVRFHVITQEYSNPGNGVYIDDIRVYNQGHQPGAWFHGNLTGNYAPNADGGLIIPVNLTGITDPAVIEYDFNWDLAGGWSDNLIVSISEDGGANWIALTPTPGIPGTNYGDESNGFTTLVDPLPPNLGTHNNSSNILLMFNVYTDGVVNYGGPSGTGWEGIFIDDIAVRSLLPTGNGSKVVLHNFTSPVGQLLNFSGSANEWVWVNHTGKDGPRTFTEGFESHVLLPAGWSIHTEQGNGWRVGTTNNSSGFGPGTWASGSKGAALGLNGKYAALTTSHLVSPPYNIPDGATASVVFNHWICTEADWDGGAIFISTDDGATWWHHGDSDPGFYDRISAANTASPFYGLGIFDGSNHPGGCSTQGPNFTYKRTDISNLSGESVRIRFTFFSDDYYEEDGWYIDDAGIAVDIHETSGYWETPLIEAEMYGWSLVDVAAEVPANTSLKLDVIAEDGSLLYEDSNFPLDLLIDAYDHPRLIFRLQFSTTNPLLSPVVERFHIGQTRYLRPNFNNGWPAMAWEYDNGNYTLNSNTGIDSNQTISGDPLIAMTVTCDCAGVGIDVGWLHNSTTTARSQWSPPPPVSHTFSNDGLWHVEFGSPIDTIWYRISVPNNTILNALDIELHRFVPAQNIEIDASKDGSNDFEWKDNSTIDGFGLTNSCAELIVDGNKVQSDVKSETIDAQSNIICRIVIRQEHAFNSNGFLGSFVAYSSGTDQVYHSQSKWNQPQLSEQGRSEISTRLNSGDSTEFLTSGTHNMPNLHDSIQMLTYDLVWNSSAPFSLHLFDINWVWDTTVHVDIPQSVVEQWLAASDEVENNYLVNFSTTLSAGEISVSGYITYDYDIVDEWLSLPDKTIIPGRIVTAQSKHTLGSQGAPLEKVRLSLTSYDSPIEVISIIELDRLDQGGRFVHLNGTGSIVSNGSEISIDNFGNLLVNWSLEGGWYLDDYPRLRWNVLAINQDGISLGPATGLSGGPSFAASTNDLEVESMTVRDQLGRTLSDWTDNLYPQHIRSGELLSVNGEVRFSGVVVNPNQTGITVRSLIENKNGTELAYSIASVSPTGSYSTDLQIPTIDIISGQELRIRTIIEHCGSLSESPDSCADRTATSLFTDFIIDDFASEVVELWVNAPGGQQYADGYVAAPNSNIALTLHLRDSDGLGEQITMYTWKQKVDDDGDGIPQSSEYQQQTILLPTGLNESWIDLPLIDSTEIANPEEGYLSIWFSGEDLAGNPITGAGNAGEDDLARIRVMPRYTSFVNTENLHIDTHEQTYLLPGKEHFVEFELTDANGLSSLDQITLDLTGSKDGDTCHITWKPWSDVISADSACFIIWPSVSKSKHPLSETWDLKFKFRLHWDVGNLVDYGQHRPSIVIEDEGNDLGLGLNSIPSLSWQLQDDLEIDVSLEHDHVQPFGSLQDDTLYVSSGDEVDLKVQLLHKGTDIAVENFPTGVYLYLNYGDDKLNRTISNDGSSHVSIILDESDSTMLFSVQGTLGTTLPLMLEIIEDSTPPRVELAPGSLVKVESNSMTGVPVNVLVNDIGGWGEQVIEMHWSFQRNGSTIWKGETKLPQSASGSDTWSFSGNVNMAPTDAQLQAGDHLFVWFIGQDLAGWNLTGEGSSFQPFTPDFWWMEFDPGLSSITSNPYRPKLGEVITIDVGVINRGLVQGNVTVELHDSEGKVHGIQDLALIPGGTSNLTFEVEAWKEGDLELMLSIPGHLESIPVPLGNVESNSDSTQGMSSLQVAGLFFLIASMVAVFVILNARSKRLEAKIWLEEE